MADLSDLNSSQAVKIAGAGATGAETNFVDASANNEIRASDIINTSGLYSSLTVGTTPVEIRVGGSRLSNRKLATLDNSSAVIIYWGYDTSISSTNYAGRIYSDGQFAIAASIAVYVVAATPGNTVHISEGS